MTQVVVAVELRMSADVAFANDQLAVRVTARYDVGVPQPTALVKTVGVRP